MGGAPAAALRMRGRRRGAFLPAGIARRAGIDDGEDDGVTEEGGREGGR